MLRSVIFGLFIFCLGLVLGLPTAFGKGTMTGIGDRPLIEYTPKGDVFELRNRWPENQEQSQECYLFAYTNYLQVANVNVFGRLGSPSISGPYLFVAKMKEFIEQSYQFGESSFHVEGGNIHDAIILTVKYGLVPDKAWKPQVAYQDWDFAQLYKDITASMKRNQKRLLKLKDQFGESSHEFLAARDEAMAQTLRLIYDYSGEIPVQFTWNGQIWTPQQFAALYGISQARQFQIYYPLDIDFYMDEAEFRRDMRSSLKTFDGQMSLLQRDWFKIEVEMMRAIDRGVPVLVAVHWWRNTGHVLTVVGYEVRNEKVFAWKILNSWGDWADRGEAFFKASEIRKKADQVWIIE